MRLIAFVFLLCLYASQSAPAAPKVIASIVPIHGLVADVMEGIGTPELLLKGLTSEHQASFSPQQISDLEKADAVFIVGGGLELKLDELSGSEAVNGKKFVELSLAPGLTTLPIREGGTWDDDEHDHEAEQSGAIGTEESPEHGKAAFDPHIWLDPRNAAAIAAAIANELSRVDPHNAEAYAANARRIENALAALESELTADLAGVTTRPFIVFHDAYQYFEQRFSLAGAGSISDFSANAPSAKRLGEIRHKIETTEAVCVFREPQFSDAAVQTVIEGTDAKSGVLDPLGANLTPGQNAYFDLLRAIAANLKACLG